MKVGVSYNVFDGEELLEGSIELIRDQVDYISVVYQKVSNFGRPCHPELEELLYDLKRDGLIDKMVIYHPKLSAGGHFNEMAKRNLGLELSRGMKCTHHMSMDTDEYYLPAQFTYMKELMRASKKEACYSQMQTYYKSTAYALDPPEDYYVSLLYTIKPGVQYQFNAPSPVLVDPTRRMPVNTYIIFSRQEVQMHHLSYVRDNIRTKLENSSASPNFAADIDRIVSHYVNWQEGQPALWGGLPSRELALKKVDDLFIEQFN